MAKKSEEEYEYQCPSCNSTVAADDKTCPKCGELFEGVEETTTKKTKLSKGDKYGGCLAFFVFTLIVVSPLFLIISFLRIPTESWNEKKWLFLLDVGITIAGIYTGIILYKKKKYAPLIAKLWLITNLITSFFVSVNEPPVLNNGLIGAGRWEATFIGSLPWFIYFITSRRVKEIYYGEKSGNNKKRERGQT